jgi:DNA gyrase/topoisomerase IV subunit B
VVMVKCIKEYEKEEKRYTQLNWWDYKRGTIVTFILMKLFYSNNRFSYDTLSAVCELSYLNKGITITFTDKEN